MAETGDQVRRHDRRALFVAGSGVAVIIFAMIVGPVFSPPQFNWLEHSTSEQAGQGIAGAWIMRAGFIAYGGAVLVASLLTLRRNLWVQVPLALFGLGLLAAAMWSNAPIVEGLPADMHEDWLHSVASGAVGAAFALACATALFAPGGSRGDLLAWGGLAIAVLIPLAMDWLPDLRGALQRAMFAYSFVFILRQFAR